MTTSRGALRAGARLLIVEDDRVTRDAVQRNLEAHGYRVDGAGHVAEALRRIDADRPDLILLDLGLPDLDGSFVVRHVRRDATTPILILSARADERDKVAALEAGADDYVTKPFGMDELRARIGALLRRATGPVADPLGIARLGPITLDVSGRRAAVNGRSLDLTPREYELLKVIVSNPGRLLTKGRLLRAVWGSAYSGEAHYLHVYVSRLRRKLEDADDTGATSALISAEPGIGYRVAQPEPEIGPADTGR
jgi:two-component system KDP operon response regulator KdpE